jgi:hypothetical protein
LQGKTARSIDKNEQLSLAESYVMRAE